MKTSPFKKLPYIAILAVLVFQACEKEEKNTETNTTTSSTTSSTSSASTTSSTSSTSTSSTSSTTSTTGGSTSSSTKPSATSIRFEANGKDCGITDGYSDQQHILSHLIHLNLDKCNLDLYRPTLTLTFESGKTIAPGTYTVGLNVAPTGNQVYINSYKYNQTDWTATSGTVVVTQNSTNSSKIDIELKSINMRNDISTDTNNPANDVLTGWIIEI